MDTVMQVVSITADLYASEQDAIYRIYVDHALMTERTFIWEPKKEYVEEQMYIYVPENLPHMIRVESLKHTVTMKNLRVNGEPANETFVV